MKNLIKTIRCNIHHCLHGFHSFNCKQARGTHHLLNTIFPQWSFIVLLLLSLVPIFSLVAQNQKAIKALLQEDKIYYTPQLAGSSPVMKQPIVGNPSVQGRRELSTDLDLRSFKRSSSALSKPQLMAKINSAKQMLTDVSIYAGTADQRSPQIVSDGSGMYVVFENYDIVGGTYPYGSVDMYKSVDGGQVWNYWNSVSSTSYHLYSPQIVLVGSDVVVSYQRNGALRTYRFDPAVEKLNPDVPVPVVSTTEYVVDHKMVTDAQKYIGTSYLYMAILFKQADGKNKVLFTISKDTARTWQAFDSLGLSQSELNASSIGLDYSSSGLYIAYLGTNTSAGSIVLRKSVSYGSSWTSETILPMNAYGGLNKKIGPMVAATGQRIAVIYQYDYKGDAIDWKTGSDFDVYADVSDDGGATWQERVVSWWTGVNEILPNVTSDYDGNFYVSFLQNGKTRISMAGSEFAFGYSDSSSTANVSMDDFPSIYGSTVSGTHTAYSTWTELSNGLDIYGAATVLKIPPLSPANLFASVVSSTQIKLSWSDNSTDETGFVIYYRQTGTGAVFAQQGVVGAGVTSSSVTGLSSSTGYEFYVRAFNANGLSLRTNIVSDTTQSGGATIPPSAPTNLIATAINANRIDISWKDNSTDEDGFRIERKKGIAGTYTEITTVGINATSYQDNTVSANTQYYYQVRAYNSAGLSAYSNEAYATTPTVVTPPAAPQNLTATVGNGQVTLKWNKNKESDFLRYRIYRGTSSNPTTKVDSSTASILDTTKLVTNLTNGTIYYFRITAVDNAGLESGFSNEVNATPNAVVDNTPPVFTVSPYTTGTPVLVDANGLVSSSPQVNASASDAGSGISGMQVAYRNTSEPNWSKSSFVYASSISFSIPTNEFVYNNKPIGVNYRVGAWDKAGNVTWSPYNSIDVQLGPQVTDKSFDMPAASQLSNKTTAYRMISVPYDLTNKQPVNLLSNFGSHMENNISYARWRFQRYVNGQYQDYDQFSQTNAVIPGAAFFFIVRDQGSQIVVQGASVVRSDVMYNTGIQLQSGWNLVGNPFNISYPIDSLEFYATASSVSQPIRQHAYYSGTGSIGGWDTSSASVYQIKPWEGVALYVNNAGILKFPSTGQRSGLPKTSRVSSVPSIEKETAGNWTLAVNAYRSDIDMRCEGSSLGMAQGANEGDDPYDSYIPPIVGDKNVAVYFKNADGAMMRDIRPPNEDGDVWEMRVVTGDAGAKVKLQWGNNLNLPNPAFEAYLIDTDQKMAHNLKEVQSLEINSGNGIRNFRVVVGKKSFVGGNNAGVALTPSSMKLYANYPNPFNPETVIRYTVPDASASYTVTLKIFNVLGQEIATLVREQKSAGYYEVKWNALQQSSGIYFYRLSITDGSKTFKDIKKMVLMK
jgi:fibronectin type 3 domain-containing protein